MGVGLTQPGMGSSKVSWGLGLPPSLSPHGSKQSHTARQKTQLTKEWGPLPALFPVRGQLVVNPRPQAITIVGSSLSFLGPGIPGPHSHRRTYSYPHTHTHTHTHRQFLANTPTQESEF